MGRLSSLSADLAAIWLRTLIIVMTLAAPVLAVPSMASGEGVVIEAQAPKNTGLGFVLMVMLQRA